MVKKMIIFIFFLLIMVGCKETESQKIRSLQLPEIDLAAVENGRYSGRFYHHDYYYETEVVVENQRIMDIRVLKSEGDKYDQEALAVLQRVIEQQSLNVDTVSGATKSSKIYLITVYNALYKPGIVIR
jgi:uncharacterized protein with FMN-binding domain